MCYDVKLSHQNPTERVMNDNYGSRLRAHDRLEHVQIGGICGGSGEVGVG